MAEQNEARNRPVVIIKKVSGGHGGHHGGSWKVAYADFVTALMAFFLLMWLLNMTSEEQKAGIAQYFDEYSVFQEARPGSGKGGGGSLSKALEHAVEAPQVRMEVQAPQQDQGAAGNGRNGMQLKGGESSSQTAIGGPFDKYGGGPGTRPATQAEVFTLMSRVISTRLIDMHEQLKIDMQDEGVRIELTGQDGRPLFAAGGAEPSAGARKAVSELSYALNTLTNDLALEAHGDLAPKAGQGHGGWKLSTDRAVAALRLLKENGLDTGRLVRVSGLGDAMPPEPGSPGGQGGRVSILVLAPAPVAASQASGKAASKPRTKKYDKEHHH